MNSFFDFVKKIIIDKLFFLQAGSSAVSKTTENRSTFEKDVSEQLKPQFATLSTVLSINDLPDDVLLKIFEYVAYEDLALNVSCVCLRWKNIVDDPALWCGSTYACDERQSLDRVLQILDNAPLLEELEILWIPHHDEVLKKVCVKCNNLRSLIMEGDITVSADTLKEVLTRCSQLNKLQFDAHFQFDVVKFPELIEQFGNLNTLTLPKIESIPNSILKSIADTCQRLEKIDIREAERVADAGVAYLIEKRSDTLVSLCVNGKKLTDAAFSKLDDMSKLTILKIMYCSLITDLTLRRIANLKLETLQLYRPKLFTSAAIRQLLTNTNMANLKMLDLAESYMITDKIVVTSLNHLQKLELLILPSFNVLGEEDLETLRGKDFLFEGR